MKKKILISMLLAAVLLGTCYAGKVEFNDEVISSLSDRQYKTVLQDLGGTASRTEITDCYLSNKAKYDSIK